MCGIEACQPEPGSDKQMRFASQSMKFESGEVVLPDEAPWLQDFIAEITGFPGTKFDDQVDSTSQALDFMNSKACGYCALDIATGRPTFSSQLDGFVSRPGSGMSSWSYFN